MSHEDRWEIEALMNRYAYGLDSGDFEGHAELFADGEVMLIDARTGTTLSRSCGAEEMVRHLRATVRVHDDGTLRTKHVTTNVTITLDEGGETASAQAYITLFQAVPGVMPIQPIFLGRYEDRFEKHDGRWRFAQRRIYADAVGRMDQHSTVAATIATSA